MNGKHWCTVCTSRGAFRDRKGWQDGGGSDVTDKSSPSSAYQPGEPSVNRFLGLPSLKSPLGVNSARADTALKGQYHRL